MRMMTIELTQGAFAIVDDCFFVTLNSHSWHAWRSKSGALYAVRNLPRFNGARRAIKMHRQVVSAPDGSLVDHINHNTLDNRLENLRICNNQENQWNQSKKSSAVTTSRYKGVHWSKDYKKWVASVALGAKKIRIGVFVNEHDAALAYDTEVSRLRGEFAATNRTLGLFGSSTEIVE
jgi:hypothetical protein